MLTNADPRTIFLHVSWPVHRLGNYRRSVPIRFAIQGEVIDEVARFAQERIELFDDYFLRFVRDRLGEYDRDRGAPKNSCGASFDIIFDRTDLALFYKAREAEK